MKRLDGWLWPLAMAAIAIILLSISAIRHAGEPGATVRPRIPTIDPAIVQTIDAEYPWTPCPTWTPRPAATPIPGPDLSKYFC